MWFNPAMIFIAVKQYVRPELAEEWPTLVQPFTQATRSEPGNLFFEWFRSIEDPSVVLVLEGFRDEEAGQAHVASEHFAEAMRELPKWLARAPEIIHVQTDQEGWGKMAELQADQPE